MEYLTGPNSWLDSRVEWLADVSYQTEESKDDRHDYLAFSVFTPVEAVSASLLRVFISIFKSV